MKKQTCVFITDNRTSNFDQSDCVVITVAIHNTHSLTVSPSPSNVHVYQLQRDRINSDIGHSSAYKETHVSKRSTEPHFKIH